MIESRKNNPCVACGEPVDHDTDRTYCPVCYWKARIRKIESDISFVSCSPQERRMRIAQNQKAVDEASRALNDCRDKYRSQQVWWRRLLGIYSDDDKVMRMGRELSRLQSRLQNSRQLFEKDPIRFLKSARKSLSIARTGLKEAQKKRERRHRNRQLDKESRMHFADQCRESLKLSFEPSQFRIRTQDFQNENPLDKFFQENFESTVLDTFDNQCVRCGSDRNLTLDHFGVTKQDGGNFILFLENNHTFKPNVIVLCRSCKRSRGESNCQDFLSKKQLRRMVGFQARLLEEILIDSDVLSRTRKWYRGR